jgi:chloramphenicol-sensitive protein RarD
VTATPLMLYAEGTKRLPLTVVGFLQYIAPTIALFLGVFVFDEPFDSISLFAFVFIWIGIAFFSYSQYRILKRAKIKV